MKEILQNKAGNIIFLFVPLLAVILFPVTADSQQKLVKVLVSLPDIENKEYQPITDVMIGSIIREFNRAGGMEIVDNSKAQQYLKEKSKGLWINSRESALEIGEALGVDIMVFSTLRKSYDNFIYTISFLQVDRDVLQRTLRGTFMASGSASEIGRKMKEETEKLLKYVPLPSELADFGSVIREETINPEFLPISAQIDDLPRMGGYGYIEQIFSYFRVFPGEEEYQKFEKQQLIMRFQFREDLDADLTRVLNNFYIYGDFAIRHNLQAFLIKDCSARAINVLLANKIPVFFTDGVIIGYEGLSTDGFCMYKTIDNQYIETFDLTHRKRMAIMFIVPKLGRKNGVSKDYLERAIGYYRDEWGKTPKLVEVKDSMFDIISSGLE